MSLRNPEMTPDRVHGNVFLPSITTDHQVSQVQWRFRRMSLAQRDRTHAVACSTLTRYSTSPYSVITVTVKGVDPGDLVRDQEHGYCT
jgi:hypothetical protein